MNNTKDTLLLGNTKEPLANTLFLGTAGGGSRFMEVNILHQNDVNMVILDVDNQLYHKTAQTLKEKGYAILRYDFYDNPNAYNPFSYMKSTESVADFAEIVASAAMPPDTDAASSFWRANSIHVLFDYLMDYGKEKDLSGYSIKQLYEDITSGNITSGKVKTDVADNILISLAASLLFYRQMESDNSLDLTTLFTEERQVLFIEMDKISTIPNLINKLMLSQLMREVTGYDRIMNTPIVFFLSEITDLLSPSLLCDEDIYRAFKRARMHDTAFILKAKSLHQLPDFIPCFSDYIVFDGVCNDTKTASFLEDNFYHALALHHIEYKEDIPRISKMLKRHRILQKIKHGKYGFRQSKNEILRLPMEYLLVFGGRHLSVVRRDPACREDSLSPTQNPSGRSSDFDGSAPCIISKKLPYNNAETEEAGRGRG